MNKDDVSLDKLFYPDSIAVIGASNSEGKLGYNVFKNLLTNGYSKRLYPVNSKTDEVQGVRAYGSVLDIDDEVDVAIIIVPASATLKAIEECCKKKIKFVVNEAAGFSEIGDEGRVLEESIKESLEGSETRMLGPNCTGIINTNAGVVQSIGVVEALEAGNIGLIGQAGVYAAGILWGLRKIMNFGIIATVGNKLDINETDILSFLGGDDNIDVICMYVEDVKAGNRFIDVATEVVKKKPIIALKGGRTSTGQKVAASHTASIAGDSKIYDAVFKQCKIIKAADNDDMFETARAFSKQPLPKGPKVMIISYAGSMGVTATDTCYENGLELAELSKESISKLRGILPPYIDAKNPVDFTFDQTGEQVAEVIKIGEYDEGVNAFVVVIQAEKAESYIEPLKGIRPTNKPVLLCIPSMEFVMESVTELEGLGYPVYSNGETAVKILSKMYGYYNNCGFYG
ncbi:MAG: CoA-binding protein [Halobacteriota archaeon]|nr:CoA-binding protein [Halobacteriota archaeon]